MIFATVAMMASETRSFAAQATFPRRISVNERAKKSPITCVTGDSDGAKMASESG